MSAASTPHPTDQTLNDYGLGKLDDGLASTVHEHLEGCPDCRHRVAQITSDSFLGRFRAARETSFQPPPGGSLDGTFSFVQPLGSAPPPPADTLPPGLANHPDYVIKRELGRGGMGVVYLAHNTMMGRDEVLKVMGRHLIERTGVLERFQREIRAVAKLRHANIVAAHTAFRIEGGLVFAMEYVEGLDLSKLVKTKGPLPIKHAAYFAHQAALGLQHAHEKGMIHRDIKPHNLMLTHDGRARIIKVLDFGLAKATQEQKIDGGLTLEGQALGTPDYIAPEQITNAPDVDIRADLYSLGGTLFYLLTGRPPFQEKSLYDVYQAHMSRDAEPLNLIRPEVPAELAALVSKLMAKEPRHRFQTPGEVAQALTPFYKKNTPAVAPIQDKLRSNVQAVEPAKPPELPAVATPAVATAPSAAEATNQAEEWGDSEPRWETLINLPPANLEPIVSKLKARPARRNWFEFLRDTRVAVGLGLLVVGLVAAIVIKDPAKNEPTARLESSPRPKKPPDDVESDPPLNEGADGTMAIIRPDQDPLLTPKYEQPPPASGVSPGDLKITPTAAETKLGTGEPKKDVNKRIGLNPSLATPPPSEIENATPRQGSGQTGSPSKLRTNIVWSGIKTWTTGDGPVLKPGFQQRVELVISEVTGELFTGTFSWGSYPGPANNGSGPVIGKLANGSITWRGNGGANASNYVCSIKDGVLEGRCENGVVVLSNMTDFFQPGTVWIGKRIFQDPRNLNTTAEYKIQILHRDGNKFSARSIMGEDNLCSYVEGSIVNNTFEFDERGIQFANYRFSVDGEVCGNEIAFRFRGTGREGNERFGTGTMKK